MGQQDNGTLLTSPWNMVMSQWHRFTTTPLQKIGQHPPEKEGKYGYFLLFTPPCVDSFHIAGTFSTNLSKGKWQNDTTKRPTWAQKVCHQGVKTSYMRFVTRGDMERQQAWSKPNPPMKKGRCVRPSKTPSTDIQQHRQGHHGAFSPELLYEPT